MRFLIPILFLLCTVSCNKEVKELPTALLVGLNDSCTYHFRNGKTVLIEKSDYGPPIVEYLLVIERDTIGLGEEFKAYLDVYRAHDVIITEPSSGIERSHGGLLNEQFIYRPVKEGIYNFAGEVRIDSVAYSFKWTFLVNGKEN